MTISSFQETMQAQGCHTNKRMAFGVKGGFPYSVEMQYVDEPNAELVFRFFVNGSTHTAAAKLNKQKLANLHWFSDSASGGGTLECVLSVSSEFYLRAGLYDVLHSAPATLTGLNLAPPQACPLCGLENCDTYADLEGGFRATHAECLSSRLSLPEQDSEPTKRVRGNVLTGILGALFGALVASAPIFAMAMNNGTIYWALYAFIPIASGFLYRTFRGKANINIAGLSVLFSSLLFAFILEMIWYWMVLSATFDVNIPFYSSIQTYFATHTLVLTLQEMMFCLAALLAGFLGISIMLRRYANSSLETVAPTRGAAYVRASAMPIEGATPPSSELASQANITPPLASHTQKDPPASANQSAEPPCP